VPYAENLTIKELGLTEPRREVGKLSRSARSGFSSKD
jgi:hypothetical protein